MRVLLANPPARVDLGNGFERYFVRAGSRWPFSFVKRREHVVGYVPFPFYLAYSAALLHRNGHEVHVIDSVPLNHTEEDFLDEAATIRPELVMIESSTPTFDLDVRLVAALRERVPGAVLCMSGSHVSVFPKESLAQAKVDVVFRQEYELSLSRFVEAWGRRCGRTRAGLGQIPGLAFIDESNGEYVEIKAEPIMDLDALPFPKRDIFPSNKVHDMGCYWSRANPQPVIQMHSSRGCPFRCNFCLWNKVIYDWGKYRVFSAKRVVDEMEYLRDTYGTKEVYFDDDTFSGTRHHVLDFCGELRRRKLGMRWLAMGDMIITDEKMLKEMAETGCVLFKFGVESGDPEVLKTVGKPVDLEKLLEMVRLCAKLGIQTHATFSYGLLGDTTESIRRTFDYACKLDVDSVQFSISTPFPGTPYYDKAQKDGLLRTESWEHFDGGRNSVVRLKDVDQSWLEEFYQTSLSRWLLHKLVKPHWVWRQVRYIRRTEKFYGTRVLHKKAWLALMMAKGALLSKLRG